MADVIAEYERKRLIMTAEDTKRLDWLDACGDSPVIHIDKTRPLGIWQLRQRFGISARQAIDMAMNMDEAGIVTKEGKGTPD